MKIQTPMNLIQDDVFISGTEGFHTFRIPALLATPQGTLLAFCEGRRNGRGDSGEIATVLKRSHDGGTTWGPLQVVAATGADTIGNPCPVVGPATGVIWLLLTRNLAGDTNKTIRAGTSRGTREVWVTSSADDGRTWAPAVEITATAKAPDWTWYATGPGVGIALCSGRLLIPCDHSVAGQSGSRSHILYSDDHGATWQMGGTVGDLTNECQAVELADGWVLINMRSLHGQNRRALATSDDGGLTWSEIRHHAALIEPVCQASLVRAPDLAGRDTLLFANPASTRREAMTVRASFDEGATWPVAQLLHAGASAYSCLAVLPGGGIGCLYERGEEHAYERITLARLAL